MNGGRIWRRKHNFNNQFQMPPGIEQTIKRMGQSEAIDRLGFFLPGLQVSAVTEQANWTPVEANQIPTMMGEDHDLEQQGGNNSTAFQLEDILRNGIFVEQQMANIFMTDLCSVTNVADVDGRLMEADPDPREENDDPAFDMFGNERNWNNWVIPTFQPTGTTTSCSPGEMEEIRMAPYMARTSSSQASQQTNTFEGGSSKYEKLLSSLHGQLYCDNEFPAKFSSLWGFGEDGQPRSDYEDLGWARPDAIFGQGDSKVYSAGIHPNDIEQGGLGDCYYLSALSSIAEWPERITRLFYSNETNQSGAYCVKLCITGIWEDIIVDDQFPVSKPGNQPAFNSSKSEELWVMLLEKAWAKVNGGYNNIVGGLIREALRDLTGAPAITYFNSQDTPDEHWKRIVEADRMGYIMACGTDDIGGTGNDSRDNSTGLCGNHAYSLLAAYEIVNEYGRKRALNPGEPSNPSNQRVVKVRNPWGQGEWKGAWSDSSSDWTDELRSQLKVEKNNDGVFFMDFNSWRKYFYDYQICYYQDNYKYSAQKFNSSPTEPTVVGFELPTQGDYYFSVNQVNKRMFRKSDRYTYSQLTMFVAHQDYSGKMTYVGSVSKADKEMWFKAPCQAGRFLAYIMTPWKRNVNEFSLSVYGPGSTQINLLQKDQVPATLLECLMLEKAKKSSSDLKSFAPQGEPNVFYKFESGSDSLGYFYFQNKSNDSQLTATIDFVEMIGTELLPPYSGRKPQVIVAPGEEKIMVYKMTGAGAKANFRMMASFKKHVQDLGGRAKKEGIRLPRSDEYGNQLDIVLYVLYHNGGVMAFYENNTKDVTLLENVRFDLRGCNIEGVPGNSIRVRVGPGKSHLVNIVKTSSNFAANVTFCNYFTLKDY